MAPKPTSGPTARLDRRVDAHAEGAAAVSPSSATLVWRLGRRGSITLRLHPTERADQLESELSIDPCCTMSQDCNGSLRGTAMICREAPEDCREADGADCQLALVLRFDRGQEPLLAVASMLRRPGSNEGSPAVLVLTDLPARLGLRGGTYLLDPTSAERAFAALQPAHGRGS
jgi:hypothetical protein